MSPTGPYYPGTASQGTGGVSWTSVSNILAEDGSVATSGLIGPGGGGGVANQLLATNFNFNIPSTAVIDGILLEAKVQSFATAVGDSGQIYLTYPSGITSGSNQPNSNSWPTAALSWISWGGSTSLWGRTWTPSDINSSSFGASISAFPGTGTGDITVDAVRITVYWHTAPSDVPKRHIYRIFDVSNNYLGTLQNVSSPFEYPQEINSAGSRIVITCAVSPDTSALANTTIDTEDGNPIQDETGDNFLTERAADVVGNDTNQILIKNGNRIKVYEISYYYPNGKLMFSGQINKWAAPYGSQSGDDQITVYADSDGIDLSYQVLTAGGTLDQSQTTNNASYTSQYASKGAGWNKYGQTFIAGSTTIAQIGLSLSTGGVNESVTINVYDSPATLRLLGTITRTVNASSATEFTFTLTPIVSSTVGTTYFLEVAPDPSGSNLTIYYNSGGGYASGSAWNSSYGGGSGGGTWTALATDLWFKTYSGGNSTAVTYSSTDTGSIALDMVSRYNGKGGLISASTTTIPTTGVTATYSFNLTTVLAGIQKVRELSPANYYWYVDIATSILYFKPTGSSPDYTIVKGNHINRVDIQASIENMHNTLYFSGGLVSTTNLYKTFSDSASIASYGQRVAVDSDNRVTLDATATLLGTSDITENKSEVYNTQVTVLDRTMDITLFKPGQLVDFAGFGNFVDRLLLQIVRIDYSPDKAILTLGKLPPRANTTLQQALNDIVALETVANPSTPS